MGDAKVNDSKIGYRCCKRANVPSCHFDISIRATWICVLAAFRGETAWESKEDRIPESIKKERLSGLSLCVVCGVIRNR